MACNHSCCPTWAPSLWLSLRAAAAIATASASSTTALQERLAAAEELLMTLLLASRPVQAASAAAATPRPCVPLRPPVSVLACRCLSSSRNGRNSLRLQSHTKQLPIAFTFTWSALLIGQGLQHDTAESGRCCADKYSACRQVQCVRKAHS